ncbi:MAG: hypothetical protein EZS28_012970 [Streblomastix strix]|uniref:Uncharacterized protein n=1 Tax=Streblomastix strix TaxID=222440 RepID=A0A5J4WAF1_9EUKA|nr:MAG: hypothetical protein EZS28_012970 [Streblomastix strix]
MQTIDLVSNYSTNGIVALYGVFTTPSYVQTIYNVYYGVDQLLHTHTGTGSSAVYSVWIHMMSGSGMVTVTVSKQGTYWPTRVTEIFYQIKWNLRIQNGYNRRFEATQLGSVQTDFMICACTLSDQWNIAVPDTGEFRIRLGSQVVQANKGLIISADGNTLSFNGSVIAGTGATSGASNGSVNYSAGNPILWGLNSVDTNGGFYSDGPKVYWRAKPIALGAVPP